MIARFLGLFSLSASGATGEPRRLPHGEGWINFALMAAGALVSAKGTSDTNKAAAAAAKEGTKTAPWEPAQEHLKFGLEESRRLYDQRQRVPPPTRDLSHLFATIPGMSLLKKHGMAMPNFVNNATEARRGGPPESQPPQGRPERGSPRPAFGGADESNRQSALGGVRLGRPSFDDGAAGGQGAQVVTDSMSDMGYDDAMAQWDYDQGFEGRELDSFLRRMRFGGSEGSRQRGAQLY